MSEVRQIISDKTVIAKTGSTMEERFRHLDSLGAQKLSSNKIYQLINSVEGLGSLGEWNRGLLSTSYQWSRGLRERGEKKDGFEISVSRTIGLPVSLIYKALGDAKSRAKWLADEIEVTKQTQDKSIRAVWSDGATRLNIDFYSLGEVKSRVVIQHLKISDGGKAETLKKFWSEFLSTLKTQLEKN